MTVADLPPRVGLFPLSWAMLLPGGRLPLTIFEPRYVSLLEHALADRRLIGMIQPETEGDEREEEALETVGTLGRVVDFSEHREGTFSVTLFGVSRFRLLWDRMTPGGWREGAIDCSAFFSDLAEKPPTLIDRPRLLEGLRAYLDHHNLQTDWAAIESLDDEMLLIVLPMLVPFDAAQKQTLLEAVTSDRRADVLLDLLTQGIEGS